MKVHTFRRAYQRLNNALVSICLLWGNLAAASPLPNNPVLRIETGMHTGTIQHISTDTQGRFLVTGSRDKTVRVWDVKAGSLQSTLRLPIGVGNEGKVFAVAISGDGKMVAVGGWTGAQWDNGAYGIYLFDTLTGQMVRRISGLPSIVYNLKFSSDGSRIAVLVKSGGLRVFQAKNGVIDVLDSSYGGEGTGLDFDGSGRLVTASSDGFLRLYDKSLKLAVKRQAPAGQEPYSVQFSPDGGKVAVGYITSAQAEVWSGQDLRLLFQPSLRGIQGQDLSSVAWSGDGKRLCAAGRWLVGGASKIRCWSGSGQGGFQDFVAGEDAVSDLVPLPNGGLVFSTGTPSWGVVDEAGKRTRFQPSYTADFRDNPRGLLVSQDGGQVRFPYVKGGRTQATFAVERHVLEQGAQAEAAVKPPRVTAAGIELTGWPGSAPIKLNGQPLPIREHEAAGSLAIAPDASWLVLGTDRYVRCFDKTGSQRWVTPAPGETQSVNISGDGQLVVAAYNDGTIRWYRASSGAELLAFFPHADKKRWVAWLPSGVYDASPNGESLLGWHVNQATDQAAEFSQAIRFRTQFYRPEAVARALRTDSPTGSPQPTPPDARGQSAQVADASLLKDGKISMQMALRLPSGQSAVQIETMIELARLEGLFPGVVSLLRTMRVLRERPQASATRVPAGAPSQ